MTNLINKHIPPVVIGGVGGSGTRLIAMCLQKIGYNIGSNLNESLDNLWFTLLFKHLKVLSLSDEDFDELLVVFYKSMFGKNDFTDTQVKLINSLAVKERRLHPSSWLQGIAKSMLENKSRVAQNANWGWKEPNSHIVLDKLIERIDELKYIHVIRNGLDMAYSENQNQLIQWGAKYLPNTPEITPKNSLSYWCDIHKNVIKAGEKLGNKFLLLNYDEFCLNPESGTSKLCQFLGIDEKVNQKNLINLIKIPRSISRYKAHDISVLNDSDVEYVKSLGFNVDC